MHEDEPWRSQEQKILLPASHPKLDYVLQYAVDVDILMFLDRKSKFKH
jgi:hypothetical protein